MMNKYENIISNIQAANSSAEMRKRCMQAEKLIKADTTLSNDEFDTLMMDITCLYRESYMINE